MATLRTVKCGETVTVTKILGEGALRRRIMDMGITKAMNCRFAKGMRKTSWWSEFFVLWLA